MANDFVHINADAKFGRLLTNLAKNLRAVREDAIEIRELMSHMRADNGSNGTGICNPFGLLPEDSATGESAFSVITGVRDALNAQGVLTMIERVG